MEPKERSSSPLQAPQGAGSEDFIVETPFSDAPYSDAYVTINLQFMSDKATRVGEGAQMLMMQSGNWSLKSDAACAAGVRSGWPLCGGSLRCLPDLRDCGKADVCKSTPAAYCPITPKFARVTAVQLPQSSICSTLSVRRSCGQPPSCNSWVLVCALQNDDYFVMHDNLAIINTVVASLCVAAVLGASLAYLARILSSVRAGKVWWPRQKRAVGFVGMQLGLQLVNAAFYLAPNSYYLHKYDECPWFLLPIHVFGFIRWTCWAAVSGGWGSREARLGSCAAEPRISLHASACTLAGR
jgi:hypothetical protein